MSPLKGRGRPSAETEAGAERTQRVDGSAGTGRGCCVSLAEVPEPCASQYCCAPLALARVRQGEHRWEEVNRSVLDAMW